MTSPKQQITTTKQADDVARDTSRRPRHPLSLTTIDTLNGDGTRHSRIRVRIILIVMLIVIARKPMTNSLLRISFILIATIIVSVIALTQMTSRLLTLVIEKANRPLLILLLLLLILRLIVIMKANLLLVLPLFLLILLRHIANYRRRPSRPSTTEPQI